jgi:hypothetical protein
MFFVPQACSTDSEVPAKKNYTFILVVVENEHIFISSSFIVTCVMALQIDKL